MVATADAAALVMFAAATAAEVPSGLAVWSTAAAFMAVATGCETCACAPPEAASMKNAIAAAAPRPKNLITDCLFPLAVNLAVGAKAPRFGFGEGLSV